MIQKKGNFAKDDFFEYPEASFLGFAL